MRHVVPCVTVHVTEELLFILLNGMENTGLHEVEKDTPVLYYCKDRKNSFFKSFMPQKDLAWEMLKRKAEVDEMCPGWGDYRI